MIEEEKTKVEIPIKKKTKKDIFRIIGIIFFIISLIILFIYKIQNPEFPLKSIILFGALFILMGIFLFFLSNIMHLFSKKEEIKDEDKLPIPATKEEMLQIVKNILENKLLYLVLPL